jgi:hypothetical protein
MVGVLEIKHNLIFIILFIQMFSFGDSMRHSDLSSSIVFPSIEEIVSFKVNYFGSGNRKLSETELTSLFVNARIVMNDDELLTNWNYSPWCDIEIETKSGDINVQLFLGGLGFVSNSKGKVAVLFEL